jgi:predicted aspartyl protease
MQCPKKMAQQSAPNAPARQNAPQQGAGNRDQPHIQYGKLNHLEANIVRDTLGVAIGTFSVESHHVNVLFDTGATHSFVTASWVETHSIRVTPMFLPTRVSSVGGRIKTDKLCLKSRVGIRGIEFPANLVVMGT